MNSMTDKYTTKPKMTRTNEACTVRMLFLHRPASSCIILCPGPCNMKDGPKNER